jgi:hypothetical protein
MLLAPSAERGEQAAVDMGRIGADVAPHLLEVDRLNRSSIEVKLFEPTAEAQEPHAAAIEAGMFERHGAAGDEVVAGPERPAGAGAEVESQRCPPHDCDRSCRRRGCTTGRRRQSQNIHGDSPMGMDRGADGSGFVLGGTDHCRPVWGEGFQDTGASIRTAGIRTGCPTARRRAARAWCGWAGRSPAARRETRPWRRPESDGSG